MKVSFVIPAYNEEKRVRACIESVLAEIARVSIEAEVVVVNNASTDKTKEIAASFVGVRVVDEPSKGLVRARKAGYEATTGELVANIDSDVLVPTGWLTVVLTAFNKNKKLVAITGPYVYYDLTSFERGVTKVWYFFGWFFNLFSEGIFGYPTMLQGGNFVIQRDAWDRVGGFDTSIIFYGEDADVARRIGTQGGVLWTWKLPVFSSGRRLRTEGVVKTGWHYAINLFSTHISGKPVTKDYTDIR